MKKLDNYNESGEQKIGSKYALESLSYGEIIDRTIRIFKDNYSYLFPTTFAIYIPYIISTIIIFIINITTTQTPEVSRLLGNLNNFISSLCTFVLIARVTTMVSEIYNGNPVDANTIKIKSSGFFGKIFTTGLYYGLGLAGYFILTFFVGGLLMAFLGAALKVIGVLIGVVALIALLFITLRWAFAHSLAVYLVPLEGISNADALNRSKQLFYSSKESMNKVMLIPIIIQALLLILFLSPTIIPIMLLVFRLTQFFTMILPYMVYTQFLIVILGVLLNPLPIIAMSVVYFDIRIRTEGFDIERTSDQAGL